MDAISPTILMVEDEPLIRLLAADALQAAGFKVVEAADAVEALALMKLHPNVRLLFTDINMPGMPDGLGLAEHFHRHWPAIRLLVTSGRHRLSNEEIPDDGHFLPKPYSLSEMIAEVSELLAA